MPNFPTPPPRAESDYSLDLDKFVDVMAEFMDHIDVGLHDLHFDDNRAIVGLVGTDRSMVSLRAPRIYHANGIMADYSRNQWEQYWSSHDIELQTIIAMHDVYLNYDGGRMPLLMHGDVVQVPRLCVVGAPPRSASVPNVTLEGSFRNVVDQVDFKIAIDAPGLSAARADQLDEHLAVLQVFFRELVGQGYTSARISIERTHETVTFWSEF